jgi:hypothetical protein
MIICSGHELVEVGKMSANVVSIAARRREGRYYDLMRYLYGLMGYVSVRELCAVLFGVSLVSATPFFYLLITHDILPCVVFMLNALVGVAIGVRNFMKSSDRSQPRETTDNVPPMPGVACCALRVA